MTDNTSDNSSSIDNQRECQSMLSQTPSRALQFENLQGVRQIRRLSLDNNNIKNSSRFSIFQQGGDDENSLSSDSISLIDKQGVLLHGRLIKRASSYRKQSRYFALTQNYLFYFRSEKDYNVGHPVKGKFQISACQFAQKGNIITIKGSQREKTKKGKNSLYISEFQRKIQFVNENNARKWFDAIHKIQQGGESVLSSCEKQNIPPTPPPMQIYSVFNRKLQEIKQNLSEQQKCKQDSDYGRYSSKKTQFQGEDEEEEEKGKSYACSPQSLIKQARSDQQKFLITKKRSERIELNSLEYSQSEAADTPQFQAIEKKKDQKSRNQQQQRYVSMTYQESCDDNSLPTLKLSQTPNSLNKNFSNFPQQSAFSKKIRDSHDDDDDDQSDNIFASCSLDMNLQAIAALSLNKSSVISRNSNIECSKEKEELLSFIYEIEQEGHFPSLPQTSIIPTDFFGIFKEMLLVHEFNLSSQDERQLIQSLEHLRFTGQHHRVESAVSSLRSSLEQFSKMEIKNNNEDNRCLVPQRCIIQMGDDTQLTIGIDESSGEKFARVTNKGENVMYKITEEQDSRDYQEIKQEQERDEDQQQLSDDDYDKQNIDINTTNIQISQIPTNRQPEHAKDKTSISSWEEYIFQVKTHAEQIIKLYYSYKQLKRIADFANNRPQDDSMYTFAPKEIFMLLSNNLTKVRNYNQQEYTSLLWVNYDIIIQATTIQSNIAKQILNEILNYDSTSSKKNKKKRKQINFERIKNIQPRTIAYSTLILNDMNMFVEMLCKYCKQFFQISIHLKFNRNYKFLKEFFEYIYTSKLSQQMYESQGEFMERVKKQTEIALFSRNITSIAFNEMRFALRKFFVMKKKMFTFLKIYQQKRGDLLDVLNGDYECEEDLIDALRREIQF